MSPTEGAATFTAGGDAYDAFMGRYAVPLAPLFADVAGVTPGQRALDVGCGTGALTGELVRRLGAHRVTGCDPSPLLEACRARHPGVDLRAGTAEDLPYDDGSLDLAVAQLVLHFVTDAPRALSEMRRVVAPDGRVAACVWDSTGGMRMLTAFSDAVREVDGQVPERLRRWPCGHSGELSQLLTDAGLEDVAETELQVGSRYDSFDELWSTLTLGTGPAGAHLATLSRDAQRALRTAYLAQVGSPSGAFTLGAVARAAVGTVTGH
ncbi:class I SAM-dependent methyltransferase [Ornithinimicrobium sp. LYQ121]|uniref:class I SAM-dependent methyltransferase n=1 Tax=Ornithinimicrobium sp. LYQ121 TaxID=3378801 RepID=UPI00385451BB